MTMLLPDYNQKVGVVEFLNQVRIQHSLISISLPLSLPLSLSIYLSPPPPPLSLSLSLSLSHTRTLCLSLSLSDDDFDITYIFKQPKTLDLPQSRFFINVLLRQKKIVVIFILYILPMKQMLFMYINQY